MAGLQQLVPAPSNSVPEPQPRELSAAAAVGEVAAVQPPSPKSGLQGSAGLVPEEQASIALGAEQFQAGDNDNGDTATEQKSAQDSEDQQLPDVNAKEGELSRLAFALKAVVPSCPLAVSS